MGRRPRNSNDNDGGDGGFGAFFRRYTKTWIHAVATAALTALGLLTFLHWFFAVLALTAYVLPPVALYLRGSSATAVAGSTERDDSPTDAAATDARSAALADDAAGPTDSAWTASDAPTDEALLDVTVVDGRAYAVGDDGGVFVTNGSDEWTTVVENGPGADSNALHGVDAAGDGGIWFAGDGGALGRLDPATDRHVDLSAPEDDTSSIADVAAASDGDDEIVLLADGSGRLRRGRFHDGELAWAEPVTPGSGASVVGVAMPEPATACVCDSDQSVFRTRDGGRRFERIGVDGADGTLTDVTVVAVADGEACAASADDGVVHRFDGTNWVPDALGDGTISALAAGGGRELACGDGGVVFERGDAPADRGGSRAGVGGTGWRRYPTPAAVPLRGCAIDGSLAVAVGDEGTVVARSVGARDPVGE